MSAPYTLGEGNQGSGRAARAIVTDDVVALNPVPNWIWVGTGGNITMQGMDSTANVVFKNVPNGTAIFFRPQYIRTTGTTAADLVAVD